MKKYALWTLLSLSSALTAQDVIKYEIEPTIGYNSFDSSSKMESTFMYGIRGTIHPNSYYGYRLSYERSDGVHYDDTSAKKTTDVQRISGQILINGEEEYSVVPYVLVGGGYESLSDATDHDVSQAYVEGGIGFKYHMKNDLIFDLEAKAMKKFDTDDIDYMVNFGLGYLFNPSLSKPSFYKPSIFSAKKVNTPKVQPKTIIKPKVVKQKVLEIKPPKVEKKLTIKPIAKVEKAKDNISALYTFKEEDVQKKVYRDYTVSQSATKKTKTLQKVTFNKDVYIQMAAWNKMTDERLLSKIENGGYNFEIKNATRANKDVQLVLVGPFDSMSDAKSVHKDLRKMAKGAFITKI